MRKILVSVAFAFVALFNAGGASAQTATQNINIPAEVLAYCTINGLATGTVINRSIPVTGAGVVGAVTAIPAIANVACNGPTDLLATSISGGVTTGVAPPSGFTNTIDYTGVATFGTATSTINTANGTAIANELGNVSSTAAATSDTLTVTITPAQPALPLMVSSAYADILRVTLTPQ